MLHRKVYIEKTRTKALKTVPYILFSATTGDLSRNSSLFFGGLLDCRQNEAAVCVGPPCKNPFKRIPVFHAGRQLEPKSLV